MNAEPHAKPATDLAIAVLVAAEGNIELAASRLGFQPFELIALLVADPNAPQILASQYRTLTLIKTFDALRLTHVEFRNAVIEMEPEEVAKTLTGLSKLAVELTSQKSDNTNLDVTGLMLRFLPPEVREAVTTLVKTVSPAPGAVQDGIVPSEADNVVRLPARQSYYVPKASGDD